MSPNRLLVSCMLLLQVFTVFAQEVRQRAPRAIPEVEDTAAQRQLAGQLAVLDGIGDERMAPALQALRSDPQAALQWARTAAKNEDPRGYYLLGIASREGIGRDKSRLEALSYFRSAADQGSYDPAFLQVAREYLATAQSHSLNSSLRDAYRYLDKGAQRSQDAVWRQRYKGLMAAFDDAEAKLKAAQLEQRSQQVANDPAMAFLALFAAAVVIGSTRKDIPSSFPKEDRQAEERARQADERFVQEVLRGDYTQGMSGR